MPTDFLDQLHLAGIAAVADDVANAWTASVMLPFEARFGGVEQEAQRAEACRQALLAHLSYLATIPHWPPGKPDAPDQQIVSRPFA